MAARPAGRRQYGFVGVGWVILVSALLQTFYNVECSRYVLATGEAPVVGWGRVPPGFLLWVPLSVFIIIFAFIAGGWAAAAGQGVYALVHGEVAPTGAEEPRIYAIALLVLVFLITAAARRISRSLELANWVMVGAILVALVLIDLFVVPFDLWWEGIRGFVTPAAPPEGITATQLGGLAGFTALASGLNWYVMGHYRDKGYGMGYRTGFISGLRGEQQRAAGQRRHVPRRRGQRRPLEAVVPAAAHRHVGRLLHRRDARHAAADDPDGARRRGVRRDSRRRRTCRRSWPARCGRSTAT